MNQFQRHLATHDRYVTSSWVPRHALPSLAFYPRLFDIVVRSSRCAAAGQYTRQRWMEACTEVVHLIERCGGRLSISRLSRLHGLSQPVVFVANHMSTMETFLLPAILLPFTDITFVVKPSVARYPVFHHVMSAVEPIVVNRVNPKDDLATVLNEGTAWLERGRSVIIFPQATRSHTIDATRFNTLGVKLAQRAGTPVIPIALKTDFWGTGWPIRDFGKIDPRKPIHFEFGTPLAPGSGNRDAKETNEAVVRFITSRLAAWSNDSP